MKSSKRKGDSKSKRVVISILRKSCLEIYKRLYIIKSIKYIPQPNGVSQILLNCECKRHKICFTTLKSNFLNFNLEKNTVSCLLCKEDKHKERFDNKHYQKTIDRNKGENIALFLRKFDGRFYMKCLKHELKYDQSFKGLKRNGCEKCLGENPKSNSKITLEKVKLDIKKWGESIIAIKILGNYNKSTGEVRNGLYRCTKRGHKGDIIKPLNRRKLSHPCDKCAIEAKSITHEEMVKRAIIIHPIGYAYSKHCEIYTINGKIHFNCPVCFNDNIRSFRSHFYKKRGCINCIRKLNGDKQIISDEQILVALKEIGKTHFRFTGHKIHDKTQKNLLRQMVCETHGKSFYAYITKSYLKHIGCEVCNRKSKMEQHIKEYLNYLNIKFEQQKRYDNCVSTNQLPFDFYIPQVPSSGKSLLVEYDGGHHFIPIYGNTMLKKQIERDAIKTDFAKSEGIQLLRIPYTKKNEIIQILNRVLLHV